MNDWLVSVPGPVRFQETPLPEESFVTTAVMVIDLPWSVCVEEADIATEIGGAEVEQEDANATASNATRLAKLLRIRLGLSSAFGCDVFTGCALASGAALRTVTAI